MMMRRVISAALQVLMMVIVGWAAWPSNTNAGPGQGTVLHVAALSSTLSPTQQRRHDLAPSSQLPTIAQARQHR
jgi:hypothetical protein